MESNKSPWPLATICGLQNRINTNPDFQRPPVWTRPQKQLLVDTILRDYDIPKLYWKKTARKPDKYEVVDGQQRLRAIWGFHAGEFSLPKNADPVDGVSIAGMKYADLPDELRIRFDIYPLDVVVLTDTEEDEVLEMFLRLQNGTTLKAQEKRNAMKGEMRKFIKGLARHKFFANSGFENSRYTFDHVAAQMTLMELSGGLCNVKDSHLNKMYIDHVEFDPNCAKAKKVTRVLDFLLKAFPDKTPELKRFNVISLYGMVTHLIERYVMNSREKELSKWFIDFETWRREQEHLPEGEADSELVLYHEKTTHSTDAIDSISWRHKFLLEKFLKTVPDIELKDDQRLFTEEQRLAVFRRDQGLCQVKLKCDGVKCEWGNWEADHIKPWSNGGKTTVANGQVACLSCNAAKGSREA